MTEGPTALVRHFDTVPHLNASGERWIAHGTLKAAGSLAMRLISRELLEINDGCLFVAGSNEERSYTSAEALARSLKCNLDFKPYDCLDEVTVEGMTRWQLATAVMYGNTYGKAPPLFHELAKTILPRLAEIEPERRLFFTHGSVQTIASLALIESKLWKPDPKAPSLASQPGHFKVLPAGWRDKAAAGMPPGT